MGLTRSSGEDIVQQQVVGFFLTCNTGAGLRVLAGWATRILDGWEIELAPQSTEPMPEEITGPSALLDRLVPPSDQPVPSTPAVD